MSSLRRVCVLMDATGRQPSCPWAREFLRTKHEILSTKIHGYTLVWSDRDHIGSLLPRPPNVPLLRALWSPLDSIWGVLKGSWGVLVKAYKAV